MSFSSVDKFAGVPNVLPRAGLAFATFGASEALKLGADEMAEPARAAKRAQQQLEEQRRAQLASEAADREAARKRAETTGQRVGLGRAAALGQFGAGSGKPTFGLGAGSLFGN